MDRSIPAAAALPAKRSAWVLIALVFIFGSADALADHPLPALGGPGGGPFEAHCQGNTVLVGLALRVGDVVDALQPLCAAPVTANSVGARAQANWQGGPGGGNTQILCPPDQPIAGGLFVNAGGDPRVVDNLLLYCGRGNGSRNSAYARPGEAGNMYSSGDDTQGCAPGEVAVGVHGRSGAYLDAVGLLCGRPQLPDAPVVVNAIGRVNTGADAGPRPPRSICEAARDARARNSPAAPNLEAQCRAAPPAPATATAETSRAYREDAGTTSRATPPPTQQTYASRDAVLHALAMLATGNHAARDAQDAPTPSGNAGTIPGEAVGGQQLNRYPPAAAPDRARAVNAHGSIAAVLQPEHSIHVAVRYPQAYGYKDAAGPGASRPDSCSAFFLSLRPISGARPMAPIRIDTQPRMTLANGLYGCHYLMTDVPFDQAFTLRVQMADQRAAGSAVWLGGSQPQPPPGQRREIRDGVREVVLSATRPSASLDFVMIYSGAP